MRILARETTEKIGQEVILKGWIDRIRKHSSVTFIDLVDRSGSVQIVKEGKLDGLNPQDVVSMKGTVRARPPGMVNTDLETGEVEVETTEEIEVLAKAAPLPLDISKKDLEVSLPTLLDHRSLTLRHSKIKAIFKVQETIVQAFRQTMKALGFVEFQAPTLVATATEGGAEIFPVKYFDHQVFLAQSPQFYKQIMVSIFERVFTVAHAYRAEPSVTTRHMTEYIGMDVEFGFIESWEEIMDIAEYLVKEIFKSVKKNNKQELSLFGINLPKIDKGIPRIKLKKAQEIIYQRTKKDLRNESDLNPEGEKEIWLWAKEKHGSDLVFITHYPTEKRPMYTFPDPEDPKYTLSFDVIGCGQEWITGGQRINDYDQLMENIKKWNYNPTDFENPYLEAFKFGMPPEGGFCLGLERITMNILSLKNIREASLFPRDMQRVDVKLPTIKSKNL